MHIKLLLIAVLSLLVCSSLLAQEPDWQSLFNQVDSLITAKNPDSAIALGSSINRQAESASGLSDSMRAVILYHYGKTLYMVKSYDKADTILLAALSIRQRIFADPHLEIAATQRFLASIYNVRGWREKADICLKEALRIQKAILGEKNLDYIHTLRVYAQHVKNWGQFERGKTILLGIMDILNQIEPSPNSIKIAVYWNLALVTNHLSDYASSKQNYQQALDLQTKLHGDTSFVAIRLRYNIASVTSSLEKYDEARKLYESLLSDIQKLLPPDHYYQGLCRSNLAGLIIDFGEFDKARTLLEEASEIFTKAEGPVNHNLANCKYHLGKIEDNLGYFNNAEKLYKESIQMIDSTFWYWDYNSYVIDPLINLAYLYVQQSRWTEAEELYGRILETQINQYGEDHIWTAESKNDLSYVYEKQGLFDKALESCREALVICEESYSANHLKFASALVRLAEIQESQKDWHAALETYNRILNIRTELLEDRHIVIAETRRRLACCYGAVNQYALAENHLEKAYQIYIQKYGEIHYYTASVLSEFADLELLRDNRKGALGYLRRSIAVYNSDHVSLHPDVCANYRKIATLLAQQGNFDSAADAYRDYTRLRKQFLDNMFVGSSEEQKLRWIQLYPAIDHTLISFAQSSGSQSLIQASLRMILEGKGAVVDAVMAERKESFCSMDDDVVFALGELGRLNSLISNLALAQSQTENSLDSIEYYLSIRDSIESELSLSCSDYADSRKYTYGLIASVAESLNPGELLCEFISYLPSNSDINIADEELSQRRYALYILDAASRLSIHDIGRTTDIDSQVRAVREMINESSECVTPEFFPMLEESLKESLAGLSKYIYQPIISGQNDIEHIIISPEGDLNLIPFEILVDSNGSYAIESHAVSYVTSGRDILTNKASQENNNTVVIMAAPDFDHVNSSPTKFTPVNFKIDSNIDFKFLPLTRGQSGCLTGNFQNLDGSLLEAEQIAEIVSARTPYTIKKYYRGDASEAHLKILETPPTILHIATHGFCCRNQNTVENQYLDNPMFHSGIILAGANKFLNQNKAESQQNENGIVTAFEISGINLTGTNLVTLSVCESGTGRAISGEGVFGLRRALRHAGANNSIISLWKVPDSETAILMKNFYSKWLAKEPIHDALRLTALEMISDMRQNRGHSHPFFWGGFVLARN